MAIFFSYFLEFNSDIFDELICEIGNGDHKFDDFVIKGKKISVFVQTKNYKAKNEVAAFDNGEVVYCGSRSKISKQDTNVFVCNSPIPEGTSPNTSFYGLPAVKIENEEVYVLYLTIDSMTDFLDANCISIDREDALLRAFSTALTSFTKVAKNSIPPFVFYTKELTEKTHFIRNLDISQENSVTFVVAPPGYGKSHLVGELRIPDARLYRFWASQDDPMIQERLSFKHFINQLSASLFNEKKKRTVGEIVDAIKNINGRFVIDGLDHVFNYNPLEKEKYIDFIDRCYAADAGLLVLTRPLPNPFYKKYEVINLEAWSKEECALYCLHEGVRNAGDQLAIFKVSQGYPLIAHYLCEEYRRIGKVRSSNPIAKLDDYYRALLSTGNGFEINVQQLGLMCILSPFVHEQDIITLFGATALSQFKSVVSAFPQLILRKNLRYYFYHDSLFCFVRDRLQSLDYSDVIERISVSLLKGEPQFMSRAPLSQFSKKQINRIAKVYSRLSMVQEVLKQTIDYESLIDFYKKLLKTLGRTGSLLTVLETYSFVAVLLLLNRNFYQDNRDLLVLLYEQLKLRKASWESQVFSSGELYGAFSYIKRNGLCLAPNDELYAPSWENASISNIYSLENAFFNVLSSDDCGYIRRYLLSRQTYLETDIFCEYLVCGYVHNHADCRASMDLYIRLGDCIEVCRKIRCSFREIVGTSSDYDIIRSCSKALNRLKCLGVVSGMDDYPSIATFLDNNKDADSFVLSESLCGYIRLATYRKKQLKLEEIMPYLLMEDAYKDATIGFLPEALAFYVKKEVFNLEDCLKWIGRANALIDRGNKGMATTFAAELGFEYTDDLLKARFFESEDFYVFIHNLPVKMINRLPYTLVLIYVLDICHRSEMRRRQPPKLPPGTFRARPYVKEFRWEGYGGRPYYFRFSIIHEYQKRAYDDGTRFEGYGYSIYIEDAPYMDWCQGRREFHFYNTPYDRPSICWNNLITDFSEANAVMVTWANRYQTILNRHFQEKSIDESKLNRSSRKRGILPTGTFRFRGNSHYRKPHMKTVHMAKSVYDEILGVLGTRKPELGGMLGWRDDQDYIDTFVFDKNARVGNAEYSPNTEYLMEIMDNEWEKKSIYLGGFVHSHPRDCSRLSDADIEYAKRIMDAFELKYLFMPIVTSSYAYKAEINPCIIDCDGHVHQCLLKTYEDEPALDEMNIDADTLKRIQAQFDRMDEVPPVKETTQPVAREQNDTYARISSVIPVEYMKQCAIIGIGCGGARDFYKDMARLGVGHFFLMDADISSKTNIASQGGYLSEIGRTKVDVTKDSILDIDPSIDVTVFPRMLNDELTDEWIEERIVSKISNTKAVLCAFTDDFWAQERAQKLAIKYQLPYLSAQHHQYGATSEVFYWYPGVSKHTADEVFADRYKAYHNGYKNTVTSDGSPVFNTVRLNALCEKIATGMLLFAHDIQSNYCSFLKFQSDKNLLIILSFRQVCTINS